MREIVWLFKGVVRLEAIANKEVIKAVCGGKNTENNSGYTILHDFNDHHSQKIPKLLTLLTAVGAPISCSICRKLLSMPCFTKLNINVMR